MQMMDTEAIGAETIGLVVEVAMVLVAMAVVERTLVITIMKGCVKKLQTSDKTREPYKKMHGDN